MTEQQWKEELSAAIDASGLPCSVFSAVCPANRSTVFAQIDNRNTKAWQQVTLSTNAFPTPEARKAEIIRQLLV